MQNCRGVPILHETLDNARDKSKWSNVCYVSSNCPGSGSMRLDGIDCVIPLNPESRIETITPENSIFPSGLIWWFFVLVTGLNPQHTIRLAQSHNNGNIVPSHEQNARVLLCKSMLNLPHGALNGLAPQRVGDYSHLGALGHNNNGILGALGVANKKTTLYSQPIYQHNVAGALSRIMGSGVPLVASFIHLTPEFSISIW